MRLAPTRSRRTIAVPWPPLDVEPPLGVFGPFLLAAERPARDDELRHLVALDGRPPTLLLRRRPWRGDDELVLGPAQRRRIETLMSLDESTVPAFQQLGLVDGHLCELTDYVFGVDLDVVSAAGYRLPWVVATDIFRTLLLTLTRMRSSSCLPYRGIEARHLRFCLEDQQPALKLCQSTPLPATDAEAAGALPPGVGAPPLFGAQLRNISRHLLDVASPPDETHGALLRDETPEAADVLADHIQSEGIPLDPLTVAKIQLGSPRNRRWLERSAARGGYPTLGATDDDVATLETFWRQVHGLAKEDKVALRPWQKPQSAGA